MAQLALAVARGRAFACDALVTSQLPACAWVESMLLAAVMRGVLGQLHAWSKYCQMLTVFLERKRSCNFGLPWHLCAFSLSF